MERPSPRVRPGHGGWRWRRAAALAALGSLVVLAPGAAAAAAANATSSSSKGVPEFTSANGELLADGTKVVLKGVNWFGFETIERVVQGLWPSATTVPTALDTLAEYGVNAMRFPLALDLVLDNPVVDKDQTAGTPALAGKTYLEVLDYVINECRKRNMLVLLDNHRMRADEPDFPDVATPKAIIPALQKLATRYCSNPSTWNVLGVDLKNEPKGTATWGSGDPDTDWALHAAEIGNAVLDKCKRWLIFVEGVQTNIKGVTVSWGQAGGSLQGAQKNPIKLRNMKKLVYSPHLISPGVDYKSPWWLDGSFPKNLPKIWDTYFGFVPEATGNAVVVGAWGAKMAGKDQKWAEAVATYLGERGIGSFYWAFNPQSADTGGLVMDDWRTPIGQRFELLDMLPATKIGDLLQKYAECTDTCAGNGRCVDGACKCYAGWSGPQCEICSPGDTTACGNAGKCQVDSTCECDKGVGGRFCGGAECPTSCGTTDKSSCFNGACMCRNGCIGNDCLACAHNASLLAEGNVGTVLCDSCPAPLDNPSAAPPSLTVLVPLVLSALVSCVLAI